MILQGSAVARNALGGLYYKHLFMKIGWHASKYERTQSRLSFL